MIVVTGAAGTGRWRWCQHDECTFFAGYNEISRVASGSSVTVTYTLTGTIDPRAYNTSTKVKWAVEEQSQAFDTSGNPTGNPSYSYQELTETVTIDVSGNFTTSQYNWTDTGVTGSFPRTVTTHSVIGPLGDWPYLYSPLYDWPPSVTSIEDADFLEPRLIHVDFDLQRAHRQYKSTGGAASYYKSEQVTGISIADFDLGLKGRIYTGIRERSLEDFDPLKKFKDTFNEDAKVALLEVIHKTVPDLAARYALTPSTVIGTRTLEKGDIIFQEDTQTYWEVLTPKDKFAIDQRAGWLERRERDPDVLTKTSKEWTALSPYSSLKLQLSGEVTIDDLIDAAESILTMGFTEVDSWPDPLDPLLEEPADHISLMMYVSNYPTSVINEELPDRVLKSVGRMTMCGRTIKVIDLNFLNSTAATSTISGTGCGDTPGVDYRLYLNLPSLHHQKFFAKDAIDSARRRDSPIALAAQVCAI